MLFSALLATAASGPVYRAASLAAVAQFYSKIRQDTHETSEREAESIVSTGRESRVARVRCNALFYHNKLWGQEGKAE